MAEELLQGKTFLSLLSSWYAEEGKMENENRQERGARLMAEEVLLAALFLLMTFYPLPAASLPQVMSLSHPLHDGVSPLGYGHIHKESEGLAELARGADAFFHKSELLVGKSIILPYLRDYLPHRAFPRRTLSKGLPFRKRSVPSLLEMPMTIPPASQFAHHMSLCDGTGVHRPETIACVSSMEEMEQLASSRLGSFDVEIVEPSGWPEARGSLSEQKEMMIREVRLMGSGKGRRSIVCDEVMMGVWVCRELEGMEKMEVRLGRKEGKEGDTVLLLHCYKQRSCDENEVCEWVSSGRVMWVMKIEEEEGMMVIPPVQERAPWVNEKFHHHHHHHHDYNHGDLIYEHETKLHIPFVTFKKKHKEFSDGAGYKSARNSNTNTNGFAGSAASENSMGNHSSSNAEGSSNGENGSGSMDQSTSSPPPPEGGAAGGAGATEGGAGATEGGGTPPPTGPGG